MKRHTEAVGRHIHDQIHKKWHIIYGMRLQYQKVLSSSFLAGIVQ
jgi:hypothetical protein